MTIKEYSVTEEILTHLRAKKEIHRTQKILMPFNIDELNNVIEETYNNLKFDLKLNNDFIKSAEFLLCDFYLPLNIHSNINENFTYIFSNKKNVSRRRYAYAFLIEKKDKFSFKIGVTKREVPDQKKHLSFGPYEIENIDMNGIDYFNFKSLPLKIKNILPKSQFITTKNDLMADLAHAYSEGIFPILDFPPKMTFKDINGEERTILSDVFENDDNYFNYVIKQDKLSDIYSVEEDEYNELSRNIQREVRFRIFQDGINQNFECVEIFLNPIKTLKNIYDDDLLILMKKAHEKIYKSDFEQFLKELNDNIHLYPITAFMTKELANGLKKNFPKKCKNNMDSFSYFK